MAPVFARFFLSSFIWLVAGNLLWAAEKSTALFVGRELNDSAVVLTKDFYDIGKIYQKVNPGRSLLLSDCGSPNSWCDLLDFSFQSIFSRAAARADKTKDPEAIARQWYAEITQLPRASEQLHPWDGQSLQTNPFQLLAVVNRMDLADWKNEVWSNAEIRFVYGPKPYANQLANLTLIFEFVLPQMNKADFKKFAQAWSAVSKARNLQSSLANVFKVGKLDQALSARLRLNHDTNGGPWQMAQWNFGGEVSRGSCRSSVPRQLLPVTFGSGPLTDQLKGQAARIGTPEYAEYALSWGAKQPAVASGMTLNACLFDETTLYPDDSLGMPTLQGICDPDPLKRRILSLQQCSYCHSSETQTEFQHIKNRQPNNSSQLSSFLTGSGSPVDLTHAASLSALITGLDFNLLTAQNPHPQPGRFVVRVKYVSYSGAPACREPNPVATDIRSFNDLARRGLFLAAILKADVNAPTQSYTTWILKNANPYRTDFTD